MTLDLGMHIAGVLSLVTMAAVALWTLWVTIAPNRHRILAALRGQPVPPAASVALPATARPQLRVVEADVEPTHDRIAA